MVRTSTKLVRALERALKNPRWTYPMSWYFPLMLGPMPRRPSGDAQSPSERSERGSYEGVNERERLVAAEVEAYVVTDFMPPVDAHVEADTCPANTPRQLLPSGGWIYRRMEDEPEG